MRTRAWREIVGSKEPQSGSDDSGAQRRKMTSATTRPVSAQADSQTASGWTLVLRRQPARVIGGRPQGGYTDAFELICCDCGDDPDLDYHHVARALQRIRGPYSISAGIAAYAEHARHHLRQAARHAAQAWAGKRPG
jgi:hypothetical protein